MSAAASLSIPTPVGPMTAREGAGGVLATFSFERAVAVSVADPPRGSVLWETKKQVDEYFAGLRTSFELPLQPEGSSFNRSVWDELLKIPFGSTMSYGELSAKLGLQNGARAVGAANGANPIAIIIPCHRVIGQTGDLIGYGGGLWRKRFLLDLESERLSLFSASNTLSGGVS